MKLLLKEVNVFLFEIANLFAEALFNTKDFFQTLHPFFSLLSTKEVSNLSLIHFHF